MSTGATVAPIAHRCHGSSVSGDGVMAVQTADLYRLEDLKDPARTAHLEDSDLRALQAVADWTTSFVLRPSQQIGRPGTVCPFLPRSVELGTLWLAAERISDRSPADVVDVVSGYKRLLQDHPPIAGPDILYKVIAIVFPDLPAERAQGVFADVQQHLGVESYLDDGILFGPYYKGKAETAIYNPSFRPFESPVPFLFVRYGVLSDWKFFLDNDDWLTLWARRYGESGVRALADELRRLPWRTWRD
jgi:hypothetical protein